MEKAALKEHRRHSTADKPFSYYISNISEYFPNVPLHWHKEFELNVILEGKGDFVTGDKHFTAYKGDIVLTPPDMLHAVYQMMTRDVSTIPLTLTAPCWAAVTMTVPQTRLSHLSFQERTV